MNNNQEEIIIFNKSDIKSQEFINLMITGCRRKKLGVESYLSETTSRIRVIPFTDNNYNNFNDSIKNWIRNCLAEFSIKEIETFDAWKTYRNIEIKTDISNWVSSQGASMETTTQEVIFYCIGKEFKKTFEKTRGNW